MFGTGNSSVASRHRGVAEHPWVRWLAHYGLGLSGAGGFLTEAREPRPEEVASRRPGPRS